MIKKIGRGICGFFIIGVAIIVGLFAVFATILFVKSKEVFFLRHYAKTHTEFTLADALGDNWDVIYHDSYAYSSGSRLAEKYGFHYDGCWELVDEAGRFVVPSPDCGPINGQSYWHDGGPVAFRQDAFDALVRKYSDAA